MPVFIQSIRTEFLYRCHHSQVPSPQLQPCNPTVTPPFLTELLTLRHLIAPCNAKEKESSGTPSHPHQWILSWNPHHKPTAATPSINDPPNHSIPTFNCHILSTPTHSIILRLKAQQLAAIWCFQLIVFYEQWYMSSGTEEQLNLLIIEHCKLVYWNCVK